MEDTLDLGMSIDSQDTIKEVIDAGDYRMVLARAKVSESKKTPGCRIVFMTFQITGGSARGKEFDDMAVIAHPTSKDAERIGKAKLVMLSKAIAGTDKVVSLKPLLNKAFVGTVAVGKDMNGLPNNNLKKASPAKQTEEAEVEKPNSDVDF